MPGLMPTKRMRTPGLMRSRSGGSNLSLARGVFNARGTDHHRIRSGIEYHSRTKLSRPRRRAQGGASLLRHHDRERHRRRARDPRAARPLSRNANRSRTTIALERGIPRATAGVEADDARTDLES